MKPSWGLDRDIIQGIGAPSEAVSRMFHACFCTPYVIREFDRFQLQSDLKIQIVRLNCSDSRKCDACQKSNCRTER